MRRRDVVAGALAAATLMLAAPALAHAQAVGSATVVPIQVTGPPASRLNLIILGDGYTAADMPKFRAQVDKHLNIQWSIEPYRSYRSYFNVYRIEVISGVSGISCDPDDGNIRRTTPLHLQYQATCPAPFDARGITFGSGGSAALNSYVAMIPGVTSANRQTLTLANTNTYGGIGGGDATTSGGNSMGPLISPHELGHSLGNLLDEYPYSTRNVPGGKYTGNEPSGIQFTLQTPAQMALTQTKWFRWLGDESESGGPIGTYESGNLFSSGIFRPSEHSIMRWLGNHYDQIGRERMTQQISGRRATAALSVNSTPTTGPVGATDVLWVETPHPAYQELDVTWKRNGTLIPNTNNTRNLKLADLHPAAGDVIQATIQDPTAFVRDPAVRGSNAMTQTRSWTVGAGAAATPVAPSFTGSTPTDRPVGGADVVYTETTHPLDHVLDVAWKLDGLAMANPDNSRNFKLAGRGLTTGTHTLTATVSDPANPAAGSDTRSWTVDNTPPTTTAELSTPVAVQPDSEPHNVYLDHFTMGLHPVDDQAGYVVGEFRLDHSGWFNYFGWVDSPDGTPFLFTPAGTTIKNLVYGSLGTGGMSKAPFEQSYPDFKPGYGTHTVEHHAIDAAGNEGAAVEFKATVLPGTSPTCTTTVTGASPGSMVVATGVTCLNGAHVGGDVIVRPGASLVVTAGSIDGRVVSDGAATVQLLSTTVLGSTQINGSTVNVSVAGSKLNGGLTLTNNAVGAYNLGLADNTIYRELVCTGNTPGVSDFGSENHVGGPKSGDCAALTGAPPLVQSTMQSAPGGTVAATLSLTLGTPASFGLFTPGIAKDYQASTTANVISTAGDAMLSVADPSATATGHLVNGTFSLPSTLQAKASSLAGTGSALANVGGSAAPTPLLTYTASVSNDSVTLAFQQHVGAADALRTGAYSKTLTFTLSTTTP
jgi:hypothetical protein